MIQSQKIRFKVLRNNAVYGEMYAADSAPTLRSDSSGEIKSSLQGTFYRTILTTKGFSDEMDFLTDEIMPVLEVDGVEHPLGVFMPASVTPSNDGTQETVSVEAYDRCWLVQDTKVEGSVYLTAGTKYMTAIEGLLSSAGIMTVLKTTNDATLTNAREEWKTGDSYITIINELLSEINYKPLWFNLSGVAILEPKSVPTAANIQHTFTDKSVDKSNSKESEIIGIYPGLSKTTDIYKSPNVFICVCSNPDNSGEMKATAMNTNPNSPLSIARRKRRIVQVEQVNNIASLSELQKYANNLLNQSMYTGETVEVSTGLLPGFGTEDVVALNLKDAFGIYVEKAWTMELTPGGKMTHTLEKVVVNIG